MKTKTSWTFYRDSLDEEGVEIPDFFLTDPERVALLTWYGSGRLVDMEQLREPTFSEYGDSKSNALDAAWEVVERWTAHLLTAIAAILTGTLLLMLVKEYLLNYYPNLLP